jgi:hypothetical protein
VGCGRGSCFLQFFLLGRRGHSLYLFCSDGRCWRPHGLLRGCGRSCLCRFHEHGSSRRRGGRRGGRVWLCQCGRSGRRARRERARHPHLLGLHGRRWSKPDWSRNRCCASRRGRFAGAWKWRELDTRQERRIWRRGRLGIRTRSPRRPRLGEWGHGLRRPKRKCARRWGRWRRAARRGGWKLLFWRSRKLGTRRGR